MTGSFIVRSIPNAITILALSLGLLSIRYSFESQFIKSVFCILLSGMCDLLDGKIARLVNSVTHFGQELDSLADLVNFGVAPAILLYAYNLHIYSKVGWIACQLFIICQALRLARFNSSNIYSDFFIGVPSPAGAILLLLPIVFDCCFKIHLSFLIIFPYTILISLALVSTMRTPSLKNINFRKHFLFLIIMCILFVSMPWITILLLTILYIAAIIFNLIY